jgi:hypothetical protein
MNSKQNVVFFLGLTLIIMVFWVNGYWTILHNGIFKPSTGNFKTILPLPKAKNGKCPPGYTNNSGTCFPLIQKVEAD